MYMCQIRTISEILETFEGLFVDYLIVFFLLVDVNHCYLTCKEWKKVEKSSLLIIHEANHFSDRTLGLTAVGLMNSSIML